MRKRDKKPEDVTSLERTRLFFEEAMGKNSPLERFDGTLKNYQPISPGHILAMIAQDLSETSVYFIENTLVPTIDGQRIIGPLTWSQVKQKRELYESLLGQNLPAREQHPFVVYELTGKLTQTKPPAIAEVDFRFQTRNLILSGLVKALDKYEIEFRKTDCKVIRHPGVIRYGEAPSLINGPSVPSVSEVYLAQTRDVSGSQMTRINPDQLKRYFDPFDSVGIITEVEVDGIKPAQGICQVKVHGQYQGSLAKPALPQSL